MLRDSWSQRFQILAEDLHYTLRIHVPWGWHETGAKQIVDL